MDFTVTNVTNNCLMFFEIIVIVGCVSPLQFLIKFINSFHKLLILTC